MSDWEGYYVVPDQRVSIAAVRLKINFDEEDGNLGDAQIQAAIDDATLLVAQKATSSNQDLLDLAVKFLAAYYAYQTYCDMINHRPEGSWEDGQFKPTTDVKVRDLAAKLAALKDDADEAMDLVAPKKLSTAPFIGVVKLGG